jgi:hypothetical protein
MHSSFPLMIMRASTSKCRATRRAVRTVKRKRSRRDVTVNNIIIVFMLCLGYMLVASITHRRVFSFMYINTHSNKIIEAKNKINFYILFLFFKIPLLLWKMKCDKNVKKSGQFYFVNNCMRRIRRPFGRDKENLIKTSSNSYKKEVWRNLLFSM